MQTDPPAEALTLAYLSKATGIPVRTIRYYVAQGLMDGPVTAGRTARYAERHLEQLQAILVAKQQGRTLGEIARHLAGSDTAAASMPAPAPVEVYSIASDVTVLLRTDIPAARVRQMRVALAAFANVVETCDVDTARPISDENASTRTHDPM